MTSSEDDGALGTGRLVAVIVAVDHCADPGIPDLRCAANDATSVGNALRTGQAAGALELIEVGIRSDDGPPTRPGADSKPGKQRKDNDEGLPHD